MNLILEENIKMPFHTDMRMVMRALPDAPEGYDWLITDIDCIAPLDERFRQGTVLISGEELADILNSHDIVFIWAVFSALPKGFRPDLSKNDRLPYVDKKLDFLHSPPQVQLPDALFEIVCFYAASTLLFGAGTEIANAFKSFFPEAMDLDSYISERKGRLFR